MSDLENAKERFERGGYSCVLCKSNTIYTSTKTGVAPLIGWIDGGFDLIGFSAVDKIIGKAAAMLFTLTGVKEVYAPVMSESGLNFLSMHGISAKYGKLVKMIFNRQGTGSCPLEAAVVNIDDPAEALKALKNKIAKLQAKQ